MKAQLKKKWMAALRSGKYQQGKGHLKKDGKFCCLGVLRDIVNPNDRRGQDGSLNAKQREEYGLNEELEEVLVSMNDGMNRYVDNQQNFKQIAAYIAEKIKAE